VIQYIFKTIKKTQLWIIKY